MLLTIQGKGTYGRQCYAKVHIQIDLIFQNSHRSLLNMTLINTIFLVATCRYTTKSEAPEHYVQYDQGEDRWLCTLLLQRGYRVEYSAASDAYTHCPTG